MDAMEDHCSRIVDRDTDCIGLVPDSSLWLREAQWNSFVFHNKRSPVIDLRGRHSGWPLLDLHQQRHGNLYRLGKQQRRCMTKVNIGAVP